MLFHRDRSCLLVIDVQQYFLEKLPPEQRAPLVQRIAWLMRVARALAIPIVVTAEDIAANGTVVPELVVEVPAGQPIFNKMIFGLADQPDIQSTVTASGRSEFVLVGLETDVCIAHSALGLAGTGHRVAVLEDGCASPAPHHEAGLRRLVEAGVVVTTIKGIHYEWVRDLVTLTKLRAAIGTALPPGITL